MTAPLAMPLFPIETISPFVFGALFTAGEDVLLFALNRTVFPAVLVVVGMANDGGFVITEVDGIALLPAIPSVLANATLLAATVVPAELFAAGGEKVKFLLTECDEVVEITLYNFGAITTFPLTFLLDADVGRNSLCLAMGIIF